jgi:hypothetical protein
LIRVPEYWPDWYWLSLRNQEQKFLRFLVYFIFLIRLVVVSSPVLRILVFPGDDKALRVMRTMAIAGLVSHIRCWGFGYAGDCMLLLRINLSFWCDLQEWTSEWARSDAQSCWELSYPNSSWSCKVHPFFSLQREVRGCLR